ncbi:hypothetical protein BH09MYX1_BH09MYX1_52760 [soil metagenome]
MRSRVTITATALAIAMVRCAGGGTKVVAPPSILPSPPPPRTDPIATDGSFWEDVPVSVLSIPATNRLPFDDKSLLGAAAYDALDDPEKVRLREAGLFVRRTAEHEGRLGAFYLAARSAKTPYVITLDTFFALVADAYAAAITEVETTVIEPNMRSMLTIADDRLAGEQRSARSDTAAAYVLARSITSVARLLLDETFQPDATIATAVRAEAQRISNHLATAASDVLGRTVDYGIFDVQGSLPSDERSLALFRARTWLAEAALVLSVRPPARPPIDVTTQRTQARAAMLLTHALSTDASPAAAKSYGAIADAELFLFGPTDDWDPRLFARLATDTQIDLRDGATYVNVAKVDQLRLLAGNQAVRARVNDLGFPVPKERDLASPVVTFRFLGSSAPPDTLALSKLVAPHIGSHFGTMTPLTLRDGARTLPTALDLAVAVGSVDAREILHETGDDAYDGFEAVIGALAAKALPPEPPQRHRTVYLSFLDAFSIYLSPSSEDVAQPTTARAPWRRHKVATVLGGWARLRHATVPFSGTRARDLVDDAGSSQDGTIAFVEPHPEALARLLGLTRQLRRGLVGLHALDAASATHVLLQHLEAILLDAFDIALREAGGSALGAKDQRTLDAMPLAIANVEKRLGTPGANPSIAVVHADPLGKRFLEVGTSFVEEATFVFRVPGSSAPVAFVGAHVPFVERAQSLRTTDAVFRGQLEKTKIATPRWQRGFRSE